MCRFEGRGGLESVAAAGPSPRNPLKTLGRDGLDGFDGCLGQIAPAAAGDGDSARRTANHRHRPYPILSLSKSVESVTSVTKSDSARLSATTDSVTDSESTASPSGRFFLRATRTPNRHRHAPKDPLISNQRARNTICKQFQQLTRNHPRESAVFARHCTAKTVTITMGATMGKFDYRPKTLKPGDPGWRSLHPYANANVPTPQRSEAELRTAMERYVSEHMKREMRLMSARAGHMKRSACARYGDPFPEPSPRGRRS